MLSPLESDALLGIIPRQGTFPWNVRGITQFEFFDRLDFFPDFSTIFTRGIAEQPVVTPPVFERTGADAPPTASALDPVSIFSDIVSVFTGPSDVNTGGGIFDVLVQGAGEIIRRQTTTAEERVLSGDFFEGDIARAIGNIGDVIGTGQQLLETFDTGFDQIQIGSQTGGQQVATQIAPCPVGGSSAGFPAGQCTTIGDWQNAGSPKGFEVAGWSSGGTLILRKKRRRRRRGGLTKGMMTDVDYLARKLGKPAAETYLNRVL